MTNNSNTSISNDFWAEFGKLVAKYIGFNDLGSIKFFVNPEAKPKQQAEQPDPQPKEDPKKAATLKMKEFGRHGITAVNPSSNLKYKISEERMAILNAILEKHPEIQLNKDGHSKQGYFNCGMAAVWIIGHYDPEGKLIDEALSVLIDAGQHNSDRGITRTKLELAARILALHQRRGAKKVKELLTKILTDQTMNSLLVLAKETHNYTQRSAIDQRVMYVEAELAKEDGIRNQFERTAC